MRTGMPAYSKTCTILGSDQKLPFTCPADTIFKLDMLPANLFTEHGAWTFRMASYLNDPRVLPEVTDSVKTVTLFEQAFELFLDLQYTGSGVSTPGLAMPLDQALRQLLPVSSSHVFSVTALFPGAVAGAAGLPAGADVAGGSVPQSKVALATNGRPGGLRQLDVESFDRRYSMLLSSMRWCCSGEQPIQNSDWVSWKIPEPEPFGTRGPDYAWVPPVIPHPDFCEQLTGKNAVFLESPNHPCTFTRSQPEEQALPGAMLPAESLA
eukprot:jgi/Botrbrau1/23262/Bobra.0102s0007.1